MATNLPATTATTGKPGSSTGSQSTTTEYVVRAPNDKSKKYSMIKFGTGTDIDFLKLTNTTVRMERENNLKEYKTANNLETQPKFGAGSEYGREQKFEARRKKFGIHLKKYNPDDQPWVMKVGKGKDCKRYKGVREGTITENTSYYIFTQCADGAFEAHPVEEWYNFQPVVQYKYLNSEEAEEEFSRRDKTMNLFSIMVRKRIKNEDDVEDNKEEKKVKSKGKKNLILTDMEDWAISSEEEEEEGEEGEKKPKKEKKKEEKKRRKNAKMNDNDEAVEESDEGDFDDRELDYISDSGSESELDEKAKDEKYDDQGVEQEQGLKKLIDSEEESSEEEEKEEEEENEEDEVKETKKEKKKKKEKKESNKEGDESESSSSSSESEESDIEKNEEKFSSVLFMQKKKGGSRSNTPTFDKSGEGAKTDGGLKRKLDSEEAVIEKKVRTESPTPSITQSSSTTSVTSSGEITEEAIRRYLSRKPMTAKELVQKFKSKKPQMSKEQMTQRIGQLLKKINPDRKYVNQILYLSLKKPE
ncbi:T2FA-like protein [Mya arenaria]|uniref:Transcription initiation factor IIF subunit alpha n=1 Tax=Mya arenaria TaxID=6604 RepID=A0ABY7FQJ9_MYAAR|nr:general transcription factor IIF subunit 1-like [Mya arenaria]WAR23594.1 T2FA-like protein [Mya arenaria]